MGRSQSWMSGVSVLALIGICLGITYVAMRGADRLVLLLGQTGADVVGRISGILLAGLAVQIIFDGLEHAPFLRPLI
jgi:multiple antibiotic resistance protein